MSRFLLESRLAPFTAHPVTGRFNRKVKMKKYIVSEDFNTIDVTIGKFDTLKEATKFAKSEAIKRINRIWVTYGNSNCGSDFQIGFDPMGKSLKF